jgi:hypothetical protein
LNNAAKALDGDMDKAIEAKREKVIDAWVESGADLLNTFVKEALKTQKTINFSIVILLLLVVFIVGVIVGMHWR